MGNRYPEPAPSDPWVALLVCALMFAALAVALWATGRGQDRTLRLLFLYLIYGLFEQVVKRAGHYAAYIYPVRYLLFAIVLVSWLADRRSGSGGRRVPLKGLLVVYLVLAGLAIFNPHLANPVVGLFGWGSDFIFALLYFVAFDIVKDESALRRFFGLTVWLGIASAAAAFVEQIVGPERLQEAYPQFVALYSWGAAGRIFYRPVLLSAFMEVFAIGVMLALLTLPKERYRRPLLLLGIFMCAVASILHGVRIAWAWMLCFFAVFVALNGRRSAWNVIGIASCVALGIWVAVGLTEGTTLVRLKTVQTPVETFSQNRLSGLLALPNVVESEPFGIGVGRTSPGLRFLDSGAAYAALGTHNYLTDLAGQMSVLGPLLLLSFCAATLRRGLRSLRGTDPRMRIYTSILVAFLAAYTVTFFMGLWLGGPLVTEYFWLLAGALMRWTYARSAAAEHAVAPYGVRVPGPVMPGLQPSR